MEQSIQALTIYVTSGVYSMLSFMSTQDFFSVCRRLSAVMIHCWRVLMMKSLILLEATAAVQLPNDYRPGCSAASSLLCSFSHGRDFDSNNPVL
jgi:hypothetical protein